MADSKSNEAAAKVEAANADPVVPKAASTVQLAFTYVGLGRRIIDPVQWLQGESHPVTGVALILQLMTYPRPDFEITPGQTLPKEIYSYMAHQLDTTVEDVKAKIEGGA